MIHWNKTINGLVSTYPGRGIKEAFIRNRKKGYSLFNLLYFLRVFPLSKCNLIAEKLKKFVSFVVVSIIDSIV